MPEHVPEHIFDGFLTFTSAELDFIGHLETPVTVTLPDWSGSLAARDHLLQAGFTEQRLDRIFRHAVRTVFAAPTLDHEVEQIVLRILGHHTRGRQFSEMGIILRARDPYAPALESMFARFGIPTSFHFATPLSNHPAVQSMIRLAAASGGTPLFDLPAAWSTHLKTLRTQLTIPDQVQIWKSTAAALRAFDTVLDNTALALDPLSPISLSAFWPYVEAALKTEKLQVPDRRRNVVHVVDVREAASWEFPIVFVPGQTQHRHIHEEERFLVQISTTRATQETILSYPRFNERGDATLRSFFLEQEGVPVTSTRILPRPSAVPPLHLPSSAEDLRTKHAQLTPTSVESFLQCPFQFFAARTLQLRARPEKPRDRLNIQLQGSILHQAIAEGNFDGVFAEQCRKHRVPRGYRTEAVRLELLRFFEAFQADRQWPLAWPSQTEQPFQIALTPDLSLAGRIDRLDTGPHHEAIVIDYKYSPAAKIRDRETPQGGLYLLAAERHFGLRPAGMFYCALREPIAWEGWHDAVPGLKLGESRTPSALRELIADAENQTIAAHNSILSGDKRVRPADPDKCRFCEYREICRVESIPAAGSWLQAAGYFPE